MSQWRSARSAISQKQRTAMRDALSLLNQCIAFYLGQDLTCDKVLRHLVRLIPRFSADCSARFEKNVTQCDRCDR